MTRSRALLVPSHFSYSESISGALASAGRGPFPFPQLSVKADSVATSARGHSRRFDWPAVASAPPQQTDNLDTDPLFRVVPCADSRGELPSAAQHQRRRTDHPIVAIVGMHWGIDCTLARIGAESRLAQVTAAIGASVLMAPREVIQ
jgi:hypothetical protein